MQKGVETHGDVSNSSESAEAREQKEKAEEFRKWALSQCLDQEARSRLNTLALAKPEKAKAVENLIIQMAQCGSIRGKLGDAEFRSLLDNVNARFHEPQVSVKFDRRRTALDSDDES